MGETTACGHTKYARMFAEAVSDDILPINPGGVDGPRDRCGREVLFAHVRRDLGRVTGRGSGAATGLLLATNPGDANVQQDRAAWFILILPQTVPPNGARRENKKRPDFISPAFLVTYASRGDKI